MAAEINTQIAKRVVGVPFKKGRSGNPLGRPKNPINAADVRAYAREYSTEAIDKLVEIMRDKKATRGVQSAAAQALLDRGIGRPSMAVAVEGSGNNVNVGVVVLPPVEGE